MDKPRINYRVTFFPLFIYYLLELKIHIENFKTDIIFSSFIHLTYLLNFYHVASTTPDTEKTKIVCAQTHTHTHTHAHTHISVLLELKF